MPHESWRDTLAKAYEELSSEYRTFLESDQGYFPTQAHYFNAFKTLPRTKVKYILFGQDPYPREESASGYAFIDSKVESIFSQTGLSKEVNRATSLRNFIKMLLVANGDLNTSSVSQEKIAQLDKEKYISSIEELRVNFERSGVLLLNTALIFTEKKESKKHIKAWRPFVQTLLQELQEESPTLILFGTHAKELQKNFKLENYNTIEMEHPYNTSFITNKKAHDLFSSMNLLAK